MLTLKQTSPTKKKLRSRASDPKSASMASASISLKNMCLFCGKFYKDQSTVMKLEKHKRPVVSQVSVPLGVFFKPRIRMIIK